LSNSSARGLPWNLSVSRAVSIIPGAIVLTVIFCGPTSRPSAFAHPTTPGRTAFESARFSIGSRTELGDMQLFDLAVLPWPRRESGFYVGVGRSRSDRFLVVVSGSKTTTEYRVLDTERPELGPRPEV